MTLINKHEWHNSRSFQAFDDSIMGYNRVGVTDSDAGVLLARQMEFVNPQILDKKYADAVLMNSGIAVSNVGGYKNFITTLRSDVAGHFKRTTNKDASAGTISLSTERTTIPVHTIEARTAWTETEIKTASEEGINLVDKYLDGVMEVYALTNEEIGWKGWGDYQDVGLATNSLFAIDTATTVIDAQTTLQSDYDTIVGWINKQRNALGGITAYYSDMLALPQSLYSLLTSKGKFTQYNYTNDNVIDAVENTYNRNGQTLRIIASPFLEASSVGGKGRAVLFSKSEECMVFRVPIPLTVSPVYQKLFNYETGYMARVAGIDILEKRSGLIIDLA